MMDINFPYTGDYQRLFSGWFSPQTTINFAGKWPVEERVITDVASYGTQLGWISDIVLALAEKKEPNSAAVQKLAHAVEQIKAIKAKHANTIEGDAIYALDRLKRENPEGFRKLVTKYRDDVNKLSTNGSGA